MLKQGILALLIIIITSCSSNGTMQPYATNASLNETWMQQVNIDPGNWIKKADPWFLTGEPNAIEKQYQKNKQPAVVSTMPVSDFTDVIIQGDFQVQIVGGQGQNSVSALGPEDMVQQISAHVKNKQLILQQMEKSKGNMRNIIVRVGVNQLHYLKNMGNSLVLGRMMISDKLNVSNLSRGSIYLGGKMRVNVVENNGRGTITIIGAESPQVSVNVVGNGNVNISGKVGVEKILHRGNGCINIIGADSNNLCITTSGSGVTSVVGISNVKDINASGSSKVYLYWVSSDQLHVSQYNQAIVGLSGSAKNVELDLRNNTCFLGQHFRSMTAYVKTNDQARVNLSANQKLFASASGNSSILYYGSPYTIFPFTSDHATIIALGSDAPLPPISVPGERIKI